MPVGIFEQAEICPQALAPVVLPNYAVRMAGQSYLGANIAALRKHLGLKQAAFAELLGTEQANISKWERGAEPKPQMLEKLAQKASRTIAEFSNEPWKPLQSVAKADQLPTRSVDAGETAQLLRLDLSLPMGPGATVDDYVEEEPVEFDLGYLRAITRTPVHRLRLARGVGDSMFPTLHSSDEVLIDTTQNQLLHSDRIYAASINGGAAIKRLRPIEGGKRILVISDNKTIEPYPVDAHEVLIWGRVIRFARDV